MPKTPRSYVIDVDGITSCYPIIFTDDTPLFASFGTVITVDEIEHMRTQNGWIDAWGGRLTNEEMKEYLIDQLSENRVRVVYNPYRTRV